MGATWHATRGITPYSFKVPVLLPLWLYPLLKAYHIVVGFYDNFHIAITDVNQIGGLDVQSWRGFLCPYQRSRKSEWGNSTKGENPPLAAIIQTVNSIPLTAGLTDVFSLDILTNACRINKKPASYEAGLLRIEQN
ncbi:hypothetical protein HVY60_14040 [Citrobacter freundii]|uniref:hypothetical protein n=1 Tax=Citrobacter freundii TaxID=546 RepID=UPI0015EF4BAD|nr:hypothetical protein [Citrobacter freundii]QMG41625.1 hypothetical protein HVY60_14040 [Citrobacter freundii]